MTGTDDIVAAGQIGQREAHNARAVGYFAGARLSRARAVRQRSIVAIAAELWEQQVRGGLDEEVHPDDVALAYSGDPDHFELFVNLDNPPETELTLPGCRVSPIEIDQPVRFRRKMALFWTPSPKGYDVAIAQRVGALADGAAAAVAAALARVSRVDGRD